MIKHFPAFNSSGDYRKAGLIQPCNLSSTFLPGGRRRLETGFSCAKFLKRRVGL